MMERVGDRWGKMEGCCSTGQSPQWAVVPVEEEEESAYSMHHRRRLKCTPVEVNMKSSLYLIKHHSMTTLGEVEGRLHALNFGTYISEMSFLCPCTFAPGESPITHFTRAPKGPRTCTDFAEKKQRSLRMSRIEHRFLLVQTVA
jgi:hypothetical protein